MASIFRQDGAEAGDLRTALTESGRRMEAAEIVRKLIDRIELKPVVRNGKKTLSVSLYGRLAGILAMATKAKAPLDESDAAMKVTKLVAGARKNTAYVGSMAEHFIEGLRKAGLPEE